MLNRDQIAYDFLLNSETLLVKEAFDKADEFIAEAKKRTNSDRPDVLNGWISVEDRLPGNSKLVIVCAKGKTNFGWFNSVDGQWWNNICSHDVTHWQPLPSPPNQ